MQNTLDQNNMENFKAYLKSIAMWGLPGLYVVIGLYIAIWIMSNIRVH